MAARAPRELRSSKRRPSSRKSGISVAVTKSPVAAAASTAMATSWSVARRVSPVTTPRRPEMSVGTAHDGRGQAAAKLADLPLVGRQTHQQRSEAEKPDANQSRAEPHADAAALFGSEDTRHSLVAGRSCRSSARGAHRSSSSSSSVRPRRDLSVADPVGSDGDAESV